jgi:ABC-type antimicrobial peptide transport system permease subunit
LGTFAAVGLTLVAVGVFSVLAYAVSRQTHDIAVRMALGAPHGQVVGMVLRQGLRLVVTGLAIGLVAAYAVSGMLARQLAGVGVSGPSTFVGVSALVMIAGIAACVIPAYQASRVDPMEVLRAE